MHCFGGAGRSGTLGACLLGDLYRIDAEEALMRIQKAFNTRGGGGAAPCATLTSEPMHPAQCRDTCVTLNAFGVDRFPGHAPISNLDCCRSHLLRCLTCR